MRVRCAWWSMTRAVASCRCGDFMPCSSKTSLCQDDACLESLWSWTGPRAEA